MKIAKHPLLAGMDQSIDRRLLPAGAIERIENLEYLRDGRLSPRTPFQLRASDVGNYVQAMLGNGTTPLALVVTAGATATLRSLDATSSYRIFTGALDRIIFGLAPGGLVPGIPFTSGPSPARVRDPDAVEWSGFTVCSYIAGSSGGLPAGDIGWLRVFRGGVSQSLTRMVGTIDAIRLISFTDRVRAIYQTQATTPFFSLYYRDFSGTSWGAESVFAHGTNRSFNTGAFDVALRDGSSYVLCYDETSALRLLQQNVSGTSYDVFRTFNFGTSHPTKTPVPSLYVDGDHNAHCAAIYRGSVKYWVVSAGGGSVASSIVTAAATSSVCGPVAVGPASGTSATIIVGRRRENSSFIQTHAVFRADSGPTITFQRSYPGLPASKPYLINEDAATTPVYWIWHCDASSFDRCYTLESTFGPSARASFRIAPGCDDKDASYSYYVPGVKARYDGGHIWPTLEMVPGENPLNAAHALNAVAFRYKHLSSSVQEYSQIGALKSQGSLVYSANQIPLVFDEEFREAAFLMGPGRFTITSATSGVSPGTRSYRVVYEAFDSRGNRYLSEPSPAITHYSTSGVNIHVPRVRSTMRTDKLRARVYATAADGGPYYDTRSVLDASRASSDQIVTDLVSFSDAGINTNEVLYESQGIFAYMCPPGTLLTPHRSRLFSADGSKLWYSTPKAPDDTAISWQDDAWIDIGAPITAIVSHGEALLAFTASQCFAIYGDGPGRTGIGEFPAPVKLFDSSGYFVAGMPVGTVFANHQGIWFLAVGSTQPELISDPVKDFLEGFIYEPRDIRLETITRVWLVFVDEDDNEIANDVALRDPVLRFRAGAAGTASYSLIYEPPDEAVRSFEEYPDGYNFETSLWVAESGANYISLARSSYFSIPEATALFQLSGAGTVTSSSNCAAEIEQESLNGLAGWRIRIRCLMLSGVGMTLTLQPWSSAAQVPWDMSAVTQQIADWRFAPFRGRPKVTTADLLEDKGEIRFGTNNGNMLVYDYTAKRWRVENSPTFTRVDMSCVAGTTPFIAYAGLLFSQDGTTEIDASGRRAFTAGVSLAPFTPGEQHSRLYSIQLQGHAAKPTHTVEVQVIGENEKHPWEHIDRRTISITSKVRGGPFYALFKLRRQQGTSWRVRLRESIDGTAGVSWNLVNYEYETIGGKRRARKGERY